MLRSRAWLLALCPLAGASFVACVSTPASSERGIVHKADMLDDPHSNANPHQVLMNHVSLDLEADFDAGILVGTATLSVVRHQRSAPLVLDTRGLEIVSVEDPQSGPLAFKLGEAHPLLGQALEILLHPSTAAIRIHYRTLPRAPALQWLSPSQTAGGRHPFLFTQGEAILTRTWIPIQDSPAVRVTYDARIRVPRDLVAIMSAEMRSPGGILEGAHKVYTFSMPQRIPAYLIALAVGDLAFKSVGPRTGVWAEPSALEAAAYEFADAESMVTAAEKLYGNYRWGRYDILVLPPSFPFGGMENPRLTFASPTCIAGDRSLVALIAHELAHSWSGNLVTNASWADFWLNEGVTVYIEGRIVEEIYGKERAAIDEVLSQAGLQRELDELGRQSPKTALWHDLSGHDPDDAITGIPYTKGSMFLRVIEGEIGRPRFDAFLKRDFDTHAFSSMTTARFLELVRKEALRGDAAAAERIGLDRWAYDVGLPANAPVSRSVTLEKVDAQVKRFLTGTSPQQLDGPEWTALERVHFLTSLPRSLEADRLKELDETWALSGSTNSEIRFEWLRLVVANRHEPAFASLREFLTKQGRRRLVLPLYEGLSQTEWGKIFAQDVYAQARSFYHPLTAGSVERLLLGL
jgi:aminopeptidase N